MAFFQKREKRSADPLAESRLPWVEKYRPKTVNEISHQDEVTKTLSKSIETANLPHLLLYGPPGTGKTSTILAIAKQLYGPKNYKEHMLELNASDDRGINVVRSRVKSFAQISVVGKPDSDYPCPPYKLIVLDEADSMTVDAQSALRRTMETYSKSTRFCLICNYVTRIIEPLASRCVKFRYRPLTKESMQSRIQYIAKNEGFEISDDCLSLLINVSGGDMRRAINLLQSAHQLDGPTITDETIIEISGKVPEVQLIQFLDACNSYSFDSLQKQVNEIIANGYSSSQFISQLLERIISSSDLNDVQKAKIAVKLSEVDSCLVEGANESLQLLDLGSFILQIFCKPN